jgi:hypothetical protein
MPREHARILTRIWDDPDFCALPVHQQRLYFLLLSRRNMASCGVLPLQVRKWAKSAADTSEEDIEKTLAELESGRYVVVDEETEEVLIRTLIRNDGVLKVPNVFKGALATATNVESPKLRQVLAEELRKLGRDDASKVAQKLFPIESGTDPEPIPNESETVDNLDFPVDNSPSPVDNLLNPNVIRTSDGVGVGEGVGEPLVGGWVGEAPSRPAPRCSKHINHDDPPPCRGCASARESGEAWDRRAEQNRAGLAAAIDAARRDDRLRCHHGTDGGLFIHPDTGKSATCARCRHQPREEAS